MNPVTGPATATERFFLRLLERWRVPCLASILALTAFMLFFAVRVEVESSNSSMVSRNPELRENYDRFRKTFGNDEMVLVALTRPQLLEPQGLEVIDRLTQDLSTVKGVTRVMSLTNALQLVPGPLGAEAAPLLPRPFAGLAPDLIKQSLERNPEVSQLLLSRDRQTGMMLVDLSGDAVRQGDVLSRIEGVLASRYGGEQLHLTGIPLLKLTVSRLIQRDQQVIVPCSVLVLGLLLLGMFRRLSGVLLPLAVMAISLCWTIGLYSLSGYPLNTITGLLPPVMMVISIATSVHLYSAWLQLSGEQGDTRALLAREMGNLFLPCLFTALTTALGLLSLLVSDIPAVQLFGFFGAIGVMLSLAVNVLVMPAALSFLPIPATGRRLYQTGAMAGMLRATARLTVECPRLVIGALIVLALLALSGIGRIQNNTDLVRFLKPAERLHRDTLAIDEAAGGVSRIEFVLTRKDGKPLTELADVKRLAALQESVGRLPQVSGSNSILGILMQLHRAEKRQETLGLPDDPEELLALFDLLEAAPDQELLRKLISSDFTRARLSVRTRAIGTSDAAVLVSRVEGLAPKLLGTEYALTPTGEYYQVVTDSNRLVASLVRSFGLSLATVFGSIFLLFRSLRLLALSLVPNLIPLAWTAGIIAYLGIDLSTGTAMIASVSIGLTVDATIHYLARYQREYRGDCREAVLRTTTETGRALTVAALVLFFGFSVGGLSSFLPTIYFSVLTGVTMLGAVVCDLLFLPASLVLHDGWRRGEP